jgi:hypothetical protein
MPELDRDQLRAFNKGFEQYSYLESDTPIPIALWIFDFPVHSTPSRETSMPNSPSVNGLIYILIPVTMIP